MTSLSRRGLLTGVAAGAVAVGWSQAAGGWVSTAQAGAVPADAVPVPALDGMLITDPAVLGRFGADFGNLVAGTPRCVLRPGSVRDIQKMIAFARANGLKVAMNGQSGSSAADFESHSSYGQAQVPGGIAIDARALSTIHHIGTSSAVVDAGVTWAQLLDATLPRGLTLASVTDYLHLSIGGTISVGGIGGQVQKFGLAADCVEEIQIVTGDGTVLTASADVRPDLFNAAVAGGGQVGVIVRARVRLVPAHTMALRMNLFYNDLSTYMADSETIMNDGRFGHQEGELVRTPDNSGWRYKIEAVLYYTPPTVPDQAVLLRGLRDDRASMEVASFTYHDWMFRMDPIEAALKDGGFWNEPKPWLSLLLPASQTRAFISGVVNELTPDDLGVGFTGLYPFRTSRVRRPLYKLPNEPITYLFDVLRFPVPGDPGIARMLEQNKRFYDYGVALGAKRYLVGAIPGMTPAAWRAHFGDAWSLLARAKRRYDPDNVLTPGQGFFA